MKKINFALSVLMVTGSFTNAVAQSAHAGMDMPASSEGGINKAICVVYPTKGNDVTGTVTFTKVAGGVRVVADLQGLTPGRHGIHIHEWGDCSTVDGTSAGGHYNPTTKSHGAPIAANRHEGDMGNIEADGSGKAHLEYTDTTISLNGENSIIGRSMIIHANEDDLITQPTGNAGARIACGVIGVGK